MERIHALFLLVFVPILGLSVQTDWKANRLNGRVSKLVVKTYGFDRNGKEKLQSTKTSEFNSSGFYTSTMTVQSDGDTTTYFVYENHKRGYCLRARNMKSNLMAMDEVESIYTYSNRLNDVTIYGKTAKGDTISIEERSYDVYDRETMWRLSIFGDVVDWISYKYDDEGRLIESIYQFEADKIFRKYVRKYVDSYNYKEYSYNGSDELLTSISRNIDASNNMLQEIGTNNSSYWEYKYDKENNWIEKIELRGEEKLRYSKTVREITYY